MGMTIDEFEEYAKAHDCVIFTRQQYEHVIDVFNNYELLLLDYYGRLKVDMVAMLTEIQSEIKESDSRAGYAGNGMPTFSTDYIRKKKVNELIRRKIKELKAERSDKE